jgi:hypothetical protein
VSVGTVTDMVDRIIPNITLIYYRICRINITLTLFPDISSRRDAMPTSSPTFLRTLLILSSGSNSKQDIGSKQIYLSLNMDTVRFSETSVNFCWTTRLHISEDVTVLCQSLSLKFILFLFVAVSEKEVRQW